MFMLPDREQAAHTLLFTGHMIDAPGRAQPRFPPEREDEVRQEIMARIRRVLEAAQQPLRGIAGGACGGDTLFHECCDEMGIPTELYLALPADRFMEASVSFAGAGWEERFRRLIDSRPCHILHEEKDSGLNEFAQANLWMLRTALEAGPTSLLALWNGNPGDGEGGTSDMIGRAKSGGAQTDIIYLKNGQPVGSE